MVFIVVNSCELHTRSKTPVENAVRDEISLNKNFSKHKLNPFIIRPLIKFKLVGIFHNWKQHHRLFIQKLFGRCFYLVLRNCVELSIDGLIEVDPF